MNTLHDVFVDQLKDMVDAEDQLITALPKLANKASTQELKNALTEHLEETKVHAERLRSILLGMNQQGGKTCEGIQGIISEGEKTIEQFEEGMVQDAAIISAAQKTEHYEISSYNSLIEYAKELDHDEALDFLQQNLSEEQKADSKLAQIATGGLFSKGVHEKAEE